MSSRSLMFADPRRRSPILHPHRGVMHFFFLTAQFMTSVLLHWCVHTCSRHVVASSRHYSPKSKKFWVSSIGCTCWPQGGHSREGQTTKHCFLWKSQLQSLCCGRAKWWPWNSPLVMDLGTVQCWVVKLGQRMVWVYVSGSWSLCCGQQCLSTGIKCDLGGKWV